MKQLTLIGITNEHNNWLQTLDDKKILIEKSTRDLHFSSESDTTVVTINSLQSRIVAYTATIDTLWNEINDNLLDIARQAEDSDGIITEQMIQQHEQIKQKFSSISEGLNTFCQELSNINLN